MVGEAEIGRCRESLRRKVLRRINGHLPGSEGVENGISSREQHIQNV